VLVSGEQAGTFEVTACSTVEEYRAACSDPARPPQRIPILQPGAVLPAGKEDGASWQIAAAAIRATVAAVPRPPVPYPAAITVVSLGGGPSSVCAGLLAGLLHAELTFASSSVQDTLAEIARNGRPAVLVGSLADFSDRLLFDVLGAFHAALEARGPWEHLSLPTLLVGRDLAALSRLIHKVVTHAAPESRRLLHASAAESHTTIRHLDLADGERATTAESATAEDLRSVLVAPSAALAYHAHGSDACARAGHGVVLCGLSAGDVPADPELPGVLACGRGYACPRGPHPLPVRDLGADVLMLGTCNGLRLGDSVLAPAFNLALSHLDGPAAAYVGSIATHSGSELATLAFLAALASGHTIGDATVLVNGLLSCSGVNQPTYLAVGLPQLRITPAPAPAPLSCEELGADANTLDFGSTNCAAVLLHDARAIALARRCALFLLATPADAGTSIYWFYRVEDAPEPTVRLWLFRFPERLGELTLTPGDANQLIRTCRGALDGLKSWLELLQMSSLLADDSDSMAAFERNHQTLTAALARRMPRIAFDASAPAELLRIAGLATSAASLARDAAIDRMEPDLERSFWLTNLYMPEYHPATVADAACPACERPAYRKRLVHPIHGRSRVIIECAHCGIVSDIPERSSIRSITLAASSSVHAASTFTVTVTVRTSNVDAAESMTICCRLSMHTGDRFQPSPARYEGTTNTRTHVASFEFSLPPDAVPHGGIVKVLVASPRALAFASRPLFILAGQR
jgi:hypothetical protein